jgi:prevent-host-death family protein
MVFQEDNFMTYNIHEAKTHFSQLIEKVNKGEKIIIANAGNPIAELVPIQNKITRRLPGLAKGQVIIKPGFDKLPKEIIEGFYK